MLLEYKTKRVPITLDRVKDDLEHMGLIDEVDVQEHFNLIKDIQENILDKYFDEDSFLRSVLFCDFGVEYSCENEICFTDNILLHADELSDPKYTQMVRTFAGDGTSGSNLMSEYLGTLYGCYPIELYLVDEKSGERKLLPKAD